MLQHVCSADQAEIEQEPDICQAVLSATAHAATELSRQRSQVTPQWTGTQIILYYLAQHFLKPSNGYSLQTLKLGIHSDNQCQSRE